MITDLIAREKESTIGWTEKPTGHVKQAMTNWLIGSIKREIVLKIGWNEKETGLTDGWIVKETELTGVWIEKAVGWNNAWTEKVTESTID